MATNGGAIVGRQYHTQQVHYLRKLITYKDDGTQKTVGYLPPGAVVVDAWAVVTTAFNDSGTDVIDIGTSGDPDGFASALDVSSVGRKAADDLATSDDLKAGASGVKVVAQYDGSNSNATAGEAVVVVAYVVDNDG